MTVGALEKMVFSVSDTVIETVQNVTWSGGARYGVHNRMSNNALTEFSGVDPDKITFDIRLSKYMGVVPMEELEKLWDYERNGKAVSFVLGNKTYGKYKWNIISHKIKFNHYDKYGSLTDCSVSVTLQEYVRY